MSRTTYRPRYRLSCAILGVVAVSAPLAILAIVGLLPHVFIVPFMAAALSMFALIAINSVFDTDSTTPKLGSDEQNAISMVYRLKAARISAKWETAPSNKSMLLAIVRFWFKHPRLSARSFLNAVEKYPDDMRDMNLDLAPGEGHHSLEQTAQAVRLFKPLKIVSSSATEIRFNRFVYCQRGESRVDPKAPSSVCCLPTACAAKVIVAMGSELEYLLCSTRRFSKCDSPDEFETLIIRGYEFDSGERFPFEDSGEVPCGYGPWEIIQLEGDDLQEVEFELLPLQCASAVQAVERSPHRS